MNGGAGGRTCTRIIDDGMLMRSPMVEGGGTEMRPSSGTSAPDRAEPGDERLERLHTLRKTIRVRDVDEVVDAAVLLEHVDVERHQHAVELRIEPRVQCLSSVEWK